MNREDMVTMLWIIEELKTNHRLDQIDFVVMMTEAFERIGSTIEYEYDLLWQRHTIRYRDRPEMEIDITWTCAIEAALELEWFMDQVRH